MSCKYPHDDETDVMVWLEYIREHIEMLAMCHSCKHFGVNGSSCPSYADAELPCSAHIHKEDLVAENLTDDLVKMERALKMVRELQLKVLALPERKRA